MFSGDSGAGRSSRNKDGDAAAGEAVSDTNRDKDKERRRKAIGSPSILSVDLKILGDVETAGDLHIDGVILGDVRSRRVTVGKDGEVKGSIRGEEVNIRGQVTGEVNARSVALSKTARVEATILHDLLTVEPGAELLGRTARRENHDAQAAEKQPPEAAGKQPPEAAGKQPPEAAGDKTPAAGEDPQDATSAKAEGKAPGGEDRTEAPAQETSDDDTASFEPLPAVIAAGPADRDESLGGKAKPADDKAGANGAEGEDSASRGSLNFKAQRETQATT